MNVPRASSNQVFISHHKFFSCHNHRSCFRLHILHKYLSSLFAVRAFLGRSIGEFSTGSPQILLSQSFYPVLVAMSSTRISLYTFSILILATHDIFFVSRERHVSKVSFSIWFLSGLGLVCILFLII